MKSPMIFLPLRQGRWLAPLATAQRVILEPRTKLKQVKNILDFRFGCGSIFLTPEAVSQFRSNMWDGDFLLSATRDNVRKFDTPLLLFMGDDLYHPQSISREIANIGLDVTFVEEWKNPESLNNTNETILSFLSKHS